LAWLGLGLAWLGFDNCNAHITLNSQPTFAKF